MGKECSAEGENSIAMGYGSMATKNTSIAIGYRAFSNQYKSIALGNDCQNIGNYSIAIGNGIKTSPYCVAIGQYNSTTDAEFVIGNGNSDDDRHDALIIDNAKMKINCLEVIPTFQGTPTGPNLGTSNYPWLEVHAKKIYLNDSRILTNDNNVIIGKQTGWNNTTGANDIFIGYRAGYKNTQSNCNIFIGYESGLNYNDKSSDGNGRGGNVFVGGYTGTAKDGASGTTTGRRNSFFGYYAGWAFEEGSNNIFIGAGAGENFTKGSGNIFIGNEAGMNATGSNKLYIDNSRTATPLIYGDFDNNTVTINGSQVFTSDQRFKENIQTLNGSLQKVTNIRGVSYTWKTNAEINQIKGIQTDSVDNSRMQEGTQLGVIAQEVENVIPEVVYTDEDGFKSVDYIKITPILIEAVKELKAEKDALEAKVEKLEKMVEELMKNK